jgi:two-component sensor histidine kinase/CHASE3 domain sensor protein
MRWAAWLRGSMMPVFIGLTTALLALALVIAQTILAQRDARIRAGNEGEMLTAFQQVMQTMLEAESSQRGYVLTADGDYLRSYLDAKRSLVPTIARLRTLAGHGPDPEAAGRVTWIAGLTDAKFSEMDRTVALTRTGMQAQAMMIVDSDIGRQQMEAVRAAVASEGARSAQQRRDAFARAATLEQRLIPLIAILGVAIVALVAAGFRAERSRATAAAEAEQAAALREANERAQLLARELNHRVKNLFSVILSIVSLSGRKQASSGDVVESIRARIHALSLAHAASQGGAAGTSVLIGPVVEKTMEPYADHERSRIRIEGPELELPVRMITPLGLIIHELATNAVKYGALSVEGGTVDICWKVTRGGDGSVDEVALNWIEAGGPPLAAGGGAPRTAGFGSQMTMLAAHQLGGGITREWPESGALARLVFPLPR